MKYPRPLRSATLALLAGAVGSVSNPAHAGDPAELPPVLATEPVQVEGTGSILDDLWGLPVLYLNEENPILQEFRITGRYQGQYAVVDSDQSDFDDWENRRWRLGAEARLFGKVTAEATINIDDTLHTFYESLDSALVGIAFSEAFTVKAGKHKPRWSHEWSTSSKSILTFERGLLVNQIKPDKSTGVTASGKSGNWSYLGGVFSGDLNDEFGNLDGGAFYLLSLGYDFSSVVSLDQLVWRVDYLLNDPDPADSAAAPYKHSVATSLELAKGRFHWVNELIYASGMSPDAYGFSSMPYFNLTEKVQFVMRYQYAHGDDDSLRVQKRYEREVPNLTDGGRGEEYHAVYGGLNYYIHGHGLKLMTGVEWATMDGGGDGGDYDGWTWFGGVRLSF